MAEQEAAKPAHIQRLQKALNLDPFLQSLDPTNENSINHDDSNPSDDAPRDVPVDKSKLFNFSQINADREWLQKLLLESSDDTSSDEITEEDYLEMLKHHAKMKKYRQKYYTDTNNQQYQYYSAGLLSNYDKYSERPKCASEVNKRKREFVNVKPKELEETDDDDDDFELKSDKSPCKKKLVQKNSDVTPSKTEELWTSMCKKEISKVHRAKVNRHKEILAVCKKTAQLSMKHCRQKALQSQKTMKETLGRAKHLTREMQSYWKRHDRVERKTKRQMEKEAEEQRKIDVEMIEAKRQQRKLNFLITQTELYAHFMSKKIGQASSEEHILKQLDEDDYDCEAAKAKAKQNAQDAFLTEGNRTKQFDINEANLGSVDEEHSQPTLFKGTLKGYQLKGMNWLANLYNQGISGILADEMGLGKTIQSLAFLCHIAERYSIWGPFLVIAPASILYNWQQEFERFAPSFTVVPYWGNPNERKILRQFWDQKDLPTKDASFHVVITSYQIVISDFKYFNRVKWQYMILDEAQAIKNTNSLRWKLLLGLSCRNRLLLTGTPIQNSMAELWALLHFIMPSLFDSHDEFNEWFSKDIESHAENKVGIDEKHLSRLHLILKPFMLRRIKKDVENELPEKIEVMVYCPFTTRQKLLYMSLKKKIKIDDLLYVGENESHSGDKNLTSNLMNLVMQFRKVCNHPNLIERPDVKSPLFIESLNYKIPKLIYEYRTLLSKQHILFNLLYIFACTKNEFSFLYYLNLSPKELYDIMSGNLLLRWHHYFETEKYLQILHHQRFWGNYNKAIHVLTSSEFCLSIAQIKTSAILQDMIFTAVSERESIVYTHHLPETMKKQTYCQRIDIPRCLLNFTPKVHCKTKQMYCNSRKAQWDGLKYTQIHSWQGLQSVWDVCSNIENFREKLSTHLVDVPMIGGIEAAAPLKSWSNISVPDKETLVTDAGKLSVLDSLLKRLKEGGHRVLIYSQMTKMIDLLEEYMQYRKHKYIRLDGSSKISDRRDMVADFQAKTDIFVFLLSTRAGGLGINLTAADTVIFYDSDWNPTVDQQAMDRAHRLGQTKQVTVYRLICKGTIEERILERAREKNEIQRMVIHGGDFNTLKPKEVVSLLLDDEEIEIKYRQREKEQIMDNKKPSKSKNQEDVYAFTPTNRPRCVGRGHSNRGRFPRRSLGARRPVPSSSSISTSVNRGSSCSGGPSNQDTRSVSHIMKPIQIEEDFHEGL